MLAFGPQNGYGLYNMIGNVWEWVGDYWTTQHRKPLSHVDGGIEPSPRGVGLGLGLGLVLGLGLGSGLG